ncbi:MAG: oligoendopeptidase F [Oscillospiraceae bacterium]|nr:oligoendopeptidase F [Oscillospiraceae bacterium]
MALKNRREMDPKFQWKLSDIFETQAAWEQAFQNAKKAVDTLGALEGTLKQSPQQLKAGLDQIYAATQQVELVYLYANLFKSGDNGDPEAQRLEGRAMSLYVALSTALSFVDPEILSIPKAELDAWLRLPELQEYRHILEDTDRMRPYSLPKEQEKMLAQLADAAGAPDEAFTMLESVDMTFPDITGEDGKPASLSHGTYGLYRDSRNRAVRKEAFETYHGEFQRYINTIAAMYSGQVKLDEYYANVRGYKNALEKSLFGNNVPVAVYDSLVEAVHGGLPIMERYLKLRKKTLKLDALHMYDLYCPMVDEVSYDIDFEDCKALVKKALAPLGEDYAKLLDKAYREQWMDVYENKGKTTGAFSCGVFGVHPYVLLNYTRSLEDAFTMAHELGHAMHSYYSAANNSFANHDYRLLVAEVASTVNEVLLTKYLLKTETDPKRRAYLLNHLLESFRTTVFRQTLFAEFERDAHEMYRNGEPLTAELLSRRYHELNELYYKGAVVDPLQDAEWARIPHFYSAYYVYQYATGFCSAVAIADGIYETGDPSGYLKFLTTGGSDYPLEELKIAGVDLTKPQVVQRALKVFESTLDELEALLETF